MKKMKMETPATRMPKGMMRRTMSHGWIPATPTEPSVMSATSMMTMPAIPAKMTRTPFQVRRNLPARYQTRAA